MTLFRNGHVLDTATTVSSTSRCEDFSSWQSANKHDCNSLKVCWFSELFCHMASKHWTGLRKNRWLSCLSHTHKELPVGWVKSPVRMKIKKIQRLQLEQVIKIWNDDKIWCYTGLKLNHPSRYKAQMWASAQTRQTIYGRIDKLLLSA